ncbi:MAG: hypothetical protein M0R03_08860 [Novosphingobium sp.]|nr:hypothetical protein [Novosphingobium sp.]
MGNETQKIVAWFMTAKKLIKFQDSTESYTVADNVMEKADFTKYPIKKGNNVNVTIEDGVVTYLRKAEGQPKSEPKPTETLPPPQTPKTEEKPPVEKKKTEPIAEPKSEEKVASQASGEEQTVTIYAVAGNKTVVKFDKDSAWVKVSSDIQTKDYKEIGLLARNTVKVTMVNDEIVKVVKVDEPAKKEKEEDKKTQQKSYTKNNDVQNSIEAQACVNSACAIVAQLVGADPTKASSANINTMKRAIATDSFDLLQELKNK